MINIVFDKISKNFSIPPNNYTLISQSELIDMYDSYSDYGMAADSYFAYYKLLDNSFIPCILHVSMHEENNMMVVDVFDTNAEIIDAFNVSDNYRVYQ